MGERSSHLASEASPPTHDGQRHAADGTIRSQLDHRQYAPQQQQRDRVKLLPDEKNGTAPPAPRLRCRCASTEEQVFPPNMVIAIVDTDSPPTAVLVLLQ